MRRNIIILALCQALAMTISSLLLSTGGLVGDSLAANPKWATLPLGMQFLFAMLATLPASLLMQRKGRRYGFLLGCLIMLAGGAGASLAIYLDSFVGFLIGMMGMGVALGFFQFFRFAAIDIAPEQYTSRAVSWVLAGGLLAAFLGPNLAAFTHHGDPAYPFMISMLTVVPISLVLALLFWRMDLPLPDVSALKGEQRSLKTIIRQPVFIVAVSTATIGYAVMILLMTATPLAMHGHGFAFGQVAFVIQWHLVGMFAPSFFSGTLMNRLGVFPVMLTGVAAYIGMVVLNMQQQSMGVYWSSLVLLGVGWNFLFVGATTILRDAWLPSEKGRVQGINDTLVFSMSSLAAMSAGILYAELGWKITNLLSLPFSLLAGAMIIYLMRCPRKPGSEFANL